MGRLAMRIHLGLPLVVGALFLWRPDLALRYLVVLATLVAHEGAHVLTALMAGPGPCEIRILPYRGVAWVADYGDRREAAIALSAPLLNLLIALGLWWAGARLTLALNRGPITDLACTANLAMGLVNLLPLPALDGGRALRALRRSRSRPE